MLVRLCPYCDHEMTKKHHCDCCNSFVWKANMADVHLNAQTRGLGEPDCAYTDIHDGAHVQEEKENFDHNMYTESKLPEVSSSRRGTAKIIAAIVVGFIIIIGIAAVILSVEVTGSLFSYSEENGYDYSDEEEYGYPEEIQLSLEDISQYTQNCTANDHLNINGEALITSSESLLKEMGYEFSSQNKYFYGYKTEEVLEQLCYEWQYSLYMGESYDEYLYINYDAVTGDVHQMDISLHSKENAEQFLEMVVYEFFDADTVASEELEALFSSEDGAYGYYMNCKFTIYPDSESDAYSLYINPVSDPYDYMEDPDIKQLSEEQVISDGLECSSDHMDILGEECVSDVEAWLAELGYKNLTAQEYSENTAFIYHQLGGTEYEVRNYRRQYIWADEETQGAFVIEADTFSDRIHSIYAGGFPVEEIEDFADIMIRLVDGSDREKIIEKAISEYTSEGYAMVDFDHYELYVTDMDNESCYVELYPLS